MQKDTIESIDDSALETVSGGHGGLIKAILEVRAEIRSEIREHVGHAIDVGADIAGGVLKNVGRQLESIGEHIQGE
jgi:hypothetical protein